LPARAALGGGVSSDLSETVGVITGLRINKELVTCRDGT
jgi:hypothetical protein